MNLLYFYNYVCSYLLFAVILSDLLINLCFAWKVGSNEPNAYRLHPPWLFVRVTFLCTWIISDFFKAKWGFFFCERNWKVRSSLIILVIFGCICRCKYSTFPVILFLYSISIGVWRHHDLPAAETTGILLLADNKYRYLTCESQCNK